MEEKDFESKTDLLKLDEAPEVVSLRKCQLVVLEGPDKNKKITLNKNLTAIGKRENNDLVLADKTVSRNHLEIEYTSDSFLLKDMGSTNGTYLNGSKVKEAYLAPGDTIKAGNTLLEFVAFDEKISIEPSAKESFGGMAGKSRKMRQIFAIIEKIAPTHATVIIEGETGTGKDLVARAIHEHSTRRAHPYMVFDCSGVAPNLIESELFGHEKGAFTGAIRSRAGVFEAAKGGTVFLDEIGELTLDLQPKLLRALESREIRRVGANNPTRIDVRVVSATNRNLKKEIEAGRFREDLYYRMSVVKILLPPLRERAEDIPLIIQKLLAEGKFNMTPTGVKVTKVDDDALKLLMRYPWPGNVRELANVMERAVVLGEGPRIDLADLPARIALVRPPLPGERASYREAVDAYRRELIVKALKQAEGNHAAAAKLLGLHRTHLFRLVKALRIG